MFFKKQIVLALLLLSSIAVKAQTSYQIKVTDEENQVLVGATIAIDGIIFAQTDENGLYKLKLKQSKVSLTISMIGFYPFSQIVDLSRQNQFALKKNVFVSEEALVTSTRINSSAAGTYSMVDKNYISKVNMGQDLPYILNQTPGVVITSDAGTGIGYTGIRIRGTDQTRTNLTINGIPLNDAESQGTFTVNIPDFATSTENIQVQRGVGSSTNGGGAFGASINIQTDNMPDTAYAEVNITQGGFEVSNLLFGNQMERYSAKVNTGLIDGHWNFSGRLSKIANIGYIENSSAVLKSFFSSASYRNERHLIKFNVFSGTEKTYLAWNGVPQDSLKTNRRYNPISDEYNDQYDNYQQDHYQIFESFKLNKRNHFNLGYHFTRGRGYFQEFRYDQNFSNYNLDTLFTGSDTILNTDILRRRWLRNTFEGIVYSWEYDSQNKFKLTVGGSANRYVGEHFGEIVWSKFASNSQPGHRFYTGWGYKNEFNIYSKANYQFTNSLQAFVDLQFRSIDYKLEGNNKDQVVLDQQHQLNFFNPKAGVSYALTNNDFFYLSTGIANKEPNRDDFINGKVNNLVPKSEQLRNIELGWKKKRNDFAIEINTYLMDYKNQLVLTGEVNNVGEYLRVNTPNSYRVGVEASGNYNFTPKLNVSANVALSRNKIKSFTESIYEYDADYNYLGVVLREHKNTDISFSPNVVAGSRIRYKLIQNLFATLESKYVGKQFMDNTSNELRKLDPFFVNDLFFDYNLRVKKYIPSFTLTVKINNVFNTLYEPNGYTYSLIESGVENNYNFYYPQAGRHYMVAMNFKF
jgi:iron complex outermembrane receptor protein